MVNTLPPSPRFISAKKQNSDVNGEFRDAWAKHKDMEQYEAKWLYVETLLKVSFLSLSQPFPLC